MKRKHSKIDDATAAIMSNVANSVLTRCLAKGGTQETCEGHALAAANAKMNPSQKMDETAPMMLAPLGTWDTAKYGKMEVTRDFADKVIANFDNKVMNEREPFIDDEHKEGESNGWFKKLYVAEVPADSEVARYGIKEALYGDVEWTPPGKEKLGSGLYKYISPHFGVYKDPVSGKEYAPVLKNAALTNIPLFSMMPSLAMSEHVVEWMCSDDFDKTIIVNLAETQDEKAGYPPVKSPVMPKASETIPSHDTKGGKDVEETKLREILKLDETADIDAAISELMEKATAADEVAELKTKLADAETKLADNEKDKTDTEKRLEAVETELATAKATAKAQAADTFVAKALSDEKIVPAQQEAIKELYLSDEKLAEKVIADAPVTKLSEEKGKEGNASEAPDKENPLAKHQERVDFYMSEAGGSYKWEQAFSLADKDVPLTDETRFVETDISVPAN